MNTTNDRIRLEWETLSWQITYYIYTIFLSGLVILLYLNYFLNGMVNLPYLFKHFF